MSRTKSTATDSSTLSSGETRLGAADPAELVRPDRVHRDVYTSPEIFEAEMDHLFERTWVFVGAESEVAEPGDYKTVQLGRYPMILARDKSGAIQLMVNRCMHRGAQVCREPKGNSSAFRCLYHGWTYGTDGRLLGVPFPAGYGGGDMPKSDFDLQRAAKVGSYHGLIFASMSSDVPSLEEHLAPAKHYLDLIVDASPERTLDVRHGSSRYSVEANWKFQLENLLDGYHPIFTHQTAFEVLEERLGYNPGKRSASEGSPGRAVSLARGHGVLDFTGTGRGYSGRGESGDDYRRSLEAVHGPERAAAVLDADIQLVIYPNLFFQSERNHFRVIRPIAPDLTEVTAYSYALKGAPDEINETQTKGLSWWASPAGFGQPDDIEALRQCQLGLRARSAPWVMFHRGLDREQQEGDEIVGDVTDEVPQRGMWREWRRLMQDYLDTRA